MRKYSIGTNERILNVVRQRRTKKGAFAEQLMQLGLTTILARFKTNRSSAQFRARCHFAPTLLGLNLLVGLPLDHFLVSHDLTFSSRQVGPFIGSDHYPVVVELARSDEQ